MWRSGIFQILISEHVLAELDRTLRSSYFSRRLTARQIMQAIDLVRAESIVLAQIDAVTGVASHHEDDQILGLASAGDVDFLVTGDRQLQALGTYQGIVILSPRAFLETLTSLESEDTSDDAT